MVSFTNTSFFDPVLHCSSVGARAVVGLMALKKSVVSTILIPLVIGTTLFSVHLRRQHFAVALSLPTMLCLRKDKKMKEMDFSFVKNVYLHPAMQEVDGACIALRNSVSLRHCHGGMLILFPSLHLQVFRIFHQNGSKSSVSLLAWWREKE